MKNTDLKKSKHRIIKNKNVIRDRVIGETGCQAAASSLRPANHLPSLLIPRRLHHPPLSQCLHVEGLQSLVSLNLLHWPIKALSIHVESGEDCPESFMIRTSVSDVYP
jgi:hypothetical protein